MCYKAINLINKLRETKILANLIPQLKGSRCTTCYCQHTPYYICLVKSDFVHSKFFVQKVFVTTMEKQDIMVLTCNPQLWTTIKSKTWYGKL